MMPQPMEASQPANVVRLPVPTFAPPAWDDDSAAQRFVEEARGKIALIKETGEWLSWTGTSWTRAGAELESRALAHRVCLAIRDELLEAAEDEEEQDLKLAQIRHKGKKEDAPTRTKRSPLRGDATVWAEQHKFAAVWRAAQTWRPAEGASTLLVSEAQLDAQPDLLPCANGTLDLKSLVLEPSNPDHWLTRSTNTIFDPNAKHERWSAFVHQIFTDSPTGRETRAFLRRWAGGMLAGRTTDQILLLLHGQGGNGKGVFVGALQQAMGKYGRTLSSTVLVAHPNGQEQHPTVLMGLMGARLAVAEEISTGSAWNEAVLKTLTGGDRIVARPMRRDEVEWDPSHSLAVVVNTLPHVGENDDAMWARLTPVLFPTKFARTETDLREQLATPEARSAVLAWCVRGLAQRQQLVERDGKQVPRGLDIPECVLAQRETYRSGEDPLTEFLREAVLDGEGTELTYDAFWTEWSLWAEDQGVPPGKRRGMTPKLQKRGWKKIKKQDKAHTDVWLNKSLVPRPGRAVSPSENPF